MKLSDAAILFALFIIPLILIWAAILEKGIIK